MITTERTKMFYSNLANNFSKIVPQVEIEDFRQEENMIDFDIPTTDGQVICSVLNTLDKYIGDKNQDFYVERFMGCGSTTISIENPVLTQKMLKVTDSQGRDRSDFKNTFTEINTHELGASTLELWNIDPKIQPEM